jgi:hypothetical protein
MRLIKPRHIPDGASGRPPQVVSGATPRWPQSFRQSLGGIKNR